MEKELKLSFEVTINPEDRKKSAELDRLLSMIEKTNQGTDEFYQATTNLLKDILVSAGERIKMTRENVDLNNPFNPPEIELFKELVFENWRGSVALQSQPQYYLPVYPPIIDR